jgi:hypothetical protein
MFDPDNLDAFPMVEDFLVRLSEEAEGGKHLEYASAEHGRLAGFPAWDHADRDLRHFIASDVPLGSIHEPYEDRDEQWRIVIFEHAGWVYVAEGAAPNATEASTRFRIRSDRYLQAWAALIDLYNPITPLDDTTDEPMEMDEPS